MEGTGPVTGLAPASYMNTPNMKNQLGKTGAGFFGMQSHVVASGLQSGVEVFDPSSKRIQEGEHIKTSSIMGVADINNARQARKMKRERKKIKNREKKKAKLMEQAKFLEGKICRICLGDEN